MLLLKCPYIYELYGSHDGESCSVKHGRGTDRVSVRGGGCCASSGGGLNQSIEAVAKPQHSDYSSMMDTSTVHV